MLLLLSQQLPPTDSADDDYNGGSSTMEPQQQQQMQQPQQAQQSPGRVVPASVDTWHRINYTRHHFHRRWMNSTDVSSVIPPSTITSTVTIRVKPIEESFISWSFLWVLFLMASIFASWQVRRENRILRQRERQETNATNPASTVAAAAATTITSTTSNTTVNVVVLEHSGGESTVSTADRTRCTFRRLLLLAMVSRLISMPVIIWSYPLWLQFVGDTLPEMIFATAWTVMVTFFVQLVASATGTVAKAADASFIIQTTAYILYSCLVLLELFNSVASVLLYALLCCIYGGLLGAIVFFCPKLWTLLQPSLLHSGSLVVRLYLCTVVCLLVCTGHLVEFARIVTAAPSKVYWWISYGVLELAPAVFFLFLMNPDSGSVRNERDFPDPEATGVDEGGIKTSKTVPTMNRVDSIGSAASANSKHHKRVVSGVGETSSLVKGGSPVYGSHNTTTITTLVVDSNNDNS